MELIDADEFENAVGECLLAISGDEGAAMRQLSANRACWATHPEDYRLTPAAAPIKLASPLRCLHLPFIATPDSLWAVSIAIKTWT